MSGRKWVKARGEKKEAQDSRKTKDGEIKTSIA